MPAARSSLARHSWRSGASAKFWRQTRDVRNQADWPTAADVGFWPILLKNSCFCLDEKIRGS
jgi:hypothetical protein